MFALFALMAAAVALMMVPDGRVYKVFQVPRNTFVVVAGYLLLGA